MNQRLLSRRGIVALPIAAGIALAATQRSVANDRPSLVGTWQVVSYEMVSPSTGEREAVRGEHPTGYAIFTSEGRFMGIITNEGRKPPSTDQDRADLFQTMAAYTGTYRVDGDKWTTKVEVAANPALVGTEQERAFRLEGDRLQETTGLMSWPRHPERGMGRAVITYRRAK